MRWRFAGVAVRLTLVQGLSWRAVRGAGRVAAAAARAAPGRAGLDARPQRRRAGDDDAPAHGVGQPPARHRSRGGGARAGAGARDGRERAARPAEREHARSSTWRARSTTPSPTASRRSGCRASPSSRSRSASNPRARSPPPLLGQVGVDNEGLTGLELQFDRGCRAARASCSSSATRPGARSPPACASTARRSAATTWCSPSTAPCSTRPSGRSRPDRGEQGQGRHRDRDGPAQRRGAGDGQPGGRAGRRAADAGRRTTRRDERLRTGLGEQGHHDRGRARGGRGATGRPVPGRRQHERGRKHVPRPRPARAEELDGHRHRRQLVEHRHDHDRQRSRQAPPRPLPARRSASARRPRSTSPASPRGCSSIPDDWSGPSIGTVPIGQGLAVTALQMLGAYNTVANGGVYVAPKLVRRTVDTDGVGACDQAVGAPAGRLDAHRAADDGDAHRGDAGRHRQARRRSRATRSPARPARRRSPRSGGGGYQDGAYVATFAGFVPAESPRLSAIVVLDEPSRRLLRRRGRGAGVRPGRALRASTASACRRPVRHRTVAVPPLADARPVKDLDVDRPRDPSDPHYARDVPVASRHSVDTSTVRLDRLLGDVEVLDLRGDAGRRGVRRQLRLARRAPRRAVLLPARRAHRRPRACPRGGCGRSGRAALRRVPSPSTSRR